MADIQTIAINAAIVGANILGTSVVSAVSNTICNKKIVKKIDVDKYEGNYEKYEKDYKKAKAKSALISTLVTVTSAVGMSCGSAYILSEFNAPVADDTNSDQTKSDLI
jgi:hypothetical protein